MDIFLTYLKVFAVGGGICIIGQLLINFTKMTSSRILVIFLLSGIIMEAVGIFDYLKDFACAIPGILSPCKEDIFDKSAPVGINNTFLYFPLLICVYT